MANNINKTTSGDVAHALSKGGLGMIPVLGSAAAEIFSLVITPPLEKRRVKWMNEIAERLLSLEGEGKININDLRDDEQFIDVVLQATTYALKTSEAGKIQAFKNTVINTALGEVPNIVKTQIFLNVIDRFTVWHIAILKFIDSPEDWFQRSGKTPPNYMMGSLSGIIKDAFPELNNEDELMDVIWADLKNSGFHNSGDLRAMMSGSGLLSERATDFGKEFLDFISE